MDWIDVVGLAEIGLAALAFLVIVLTVWLIPRGPHQDEPCEHGNETIWCPECREGR